MNVNINRALWNLVDNDYGSSCPVANNTITILPDGTVLPCRRLPIKIGDIFDNSVADIMYGSILLNDFRKRYFHECSDCEQSKTCNGGCQGISFMSNGMLFNKADPQCWLVNDKIQESTTKFDYPFIEKYGYYIMKESRLYPNLLES